MAGEEKTALEIILELPSILKKIENKIDVLDTNLKILNTKLNKIKAQEIISDSKQEIRPQAAQAVAEDQTKSEGTMRPTATPGPTESVSGGMPNLKPIQTHLLLTLT